MFKSLKGCTVMITGASHGIGLGMAEIFGREGCNLILVARHKETLDRCLEHLQTKGCTLALACAADVRSLQALKDAAGQGAALFGGIDILCANAGIFPQVPLEVLSEEDLSLVLDTNIKGTFFAVQACLPYLKKSGRGRIILTSSITGPVTGYPGWAHYGATKAAQLGFMHTAAIELAPYGITVNAVSPGNVMSEGLSDLGSDYIEGMQSCVPTGKLGTVYDIANAALFLSAEEAGYINGQNLIIDGGQILPESPAALDEMRALAKA